MNTRPHSGLQRLIDEAREREVAVDPASCPDHWHCDPSLAAHLCETYGKGHPQRGQRIDRTRPCPTCGDSPMSADATLLDFEERTGVAAERVTFFVGSDAWRRFREACEVNGIAHFDALREYIDGVTGP